MVITWHFDFMHSEELRYSRLSEGQDIPNTTRCRSRTKAIYLLTILYSILCLSSPEYQVRCANLLHRCWRRLVHVALHHPEKHSEANQESLYSTRPPALPPANPGSEPLSELTIMSPSHCFGGRVIDAILILYLVADVGTMLRHRYVLL